MNHFLNDEYALTEHKGVPVVSSRSIAEKFEKRHDVVLRSVETAECSEDFRNRNFVVSSYREGKGKYKEYLLTKNGFAFVVMGFTGKKAAHFKENYILAFDAMYEFIQSLSTAKLEFPEFTRAIMAAHDEPKHYHFSNEINLINRIVLGMDAKRFKEANGIDEKAPSIRPYLSLPQIKAIEALQKFDIGLIVTVPEFEDRKRHLTDYFSRLTGLKLLS
jgi:Rha family phage regulatory protein